MYAIIANDKCTNKTNKSEKVFSSNESKQRVKFDSKIRSNVRSK